MGLLDWSPAEASSDDLSFPNFDSSWGTPSSSSPPSPKPQSMRKPPPDVSVNVVSPAFTASGADCTNCSSNSHQTTEPFPSINSSDDSMSSSIRWASNTASAKNLAIPREFKNSGRSERRHSAPQPRRKRARSTASTADPGRPRSTSFDLFGDDEELQEAESRIGFCDICLRQCEIHATG